MMMIIKIKKDVMVRSVICNLACVASGLRFWGRREKNERPQDPPPPTPPKPQTASNASYGIYNRACVYQQPLQRSTHISKIKEFSQTDSRKKIKSCTDTEHNT